MHSEAELRRQIADVSRRIYEKGLVAASDGNVSARLDAARILATPSGVPLEKITPENIVMSDMTGKKLSGTHKSTSETMMHLAVYEERPDVNAVVHAHAPYATAITVAGLSLEADILPEVAVTLGRIVTAPYATPASDEGARAIREVIRQTDGVLLDRHGALTVGADPWDAYYRMEKVENAAKVVFLARLIGAPREMTRDEIDRLVAALAAKGVTAKIARWLD